MKIHQLPKDVHSYFPFICYLILLVALMPTAEKFEYEYRKGTPWKYDTLVAEFDFPVYKTEAQMEKEILNARQQVIPYFNYSEDIAEKNISAAEKASYGGGDGVRYAVVSSLRKLYAQGIMPDDVSALEKKMTLSEDLIYIQKGKRATKYPLTEVYTLSDAREKLQKDLSKDFPGISADSLLKSTGTYDRLEPNLVYDRQSTTLAHDDASLTISPTEGFVNAGSIIITEGEIVTTEIAQLLDSYKKEYESNVGSDSPSIVGWLMNLLLALILTSLLFFVIFFIDPSVFSRQKDLIFLVFVAALAVLPVLILLDFDVVGHIYLIPFTVFALYLQTFYPNKVIVPIYMVSLIPAAVLLPQGAPLFVMYTLAGLVAIKLFDVFNSGWKQFITAFAIFLTLALCYGVFRRLGMLSGMPLRNLMNLFMGSLLSIAAYQLIFLFEKLFSLVSVSRLDGLADTNAPLLRELEIKAPGTFQHSLQVKSMADTVARAIGANEHLVRAAAMYHDIGKMVNPQCFIENEALVAGEKTGRYHTGLSSEQSAHDIIRHVPDGLEIARRAGLPEQIIGFIVSHHGTSCTRYFYNKYINEGGDASEAAKFTYRGLKPVTKEQVILMLCDSIEAASRTLQDHSAESFSRFVEDMVASKIREGQLSDAEISIKELNTVKEVLKGYLSQLYHERVKYPKRTNN